MHESESSSASMMLTKTNYIEWSLLMQVKLQAKGLWTVVANGNDDERDNRRALSVILTGMPPKMLRVLTAKDMAKTA